MYRLCVFAGTTEGRKLAEFLSGQRVAVTVCVATEYGETFLPPAGNLTVSAKRLPAAEITEMLSQTRFDLVIDATHPYAASVTESIWAACAATGTEYLRLLREASERAPDDVYVPDTRSAADFLNRTEGAILLTTGSKDLGAFSAIANFPDRVYARVLPLASSLEACRAAGLKAGRIIAMQGPFSEEMNLATLRFTSAAWLVTKDGGAAGGFEAKAAAAAKAGARMVVIGRPPQREGRSFAETVELLCARFGCVRRPRVSVLGIGPGSRETMTDAVRRAIQGADCLIGAKRMLEAAALPGQAQYEAVAPEKIAEYIFAHPEYGRFGVVLSGDVGFFSGAKKLLPLLDGCDVEVLPGVSSLAYLSARLKTAYEDVAVVSVHGRRHSVVPDVRGNRRVFVLTGGEDGINDLCRALADAGLENVKLSVGQRLSYPDEKITRGTAGELKDGVYPALSVALIENDCPDAVVTPGLPDSAFLRDGAAEERVPMTKSEVRAVCLSKLQLTEGSVCWDIGAGTGSVAIEMALQAKKGQVYAIEQRTEAAQLLKRNKDRFRVENLTVVSGSAPDACRDLPAPSHAFVGGSSGGMRDILSLLLEKNPKVRIVATAISLESIAELTACMRELPFAETEVVSIQVARDKKAGAYHLMTGRNPVYIFTMGSGGTEK